MSVEITIGPPLLSIGKGYTVFSSEPDGQIHPGGDKGLYFFDTRLVSAYRVYANGSEFELLNAASVYYYAARSFLINPAIETEAGTIPAGTLGLVISRTVDGGVHEDLDITNYGQKKVVFNFEVLLRSDFADLFDIKNGRIVRRGRITMDWDQNASLLRCAYSNGAFHRELVVCIRNCASPRHHANGRLTFEVAIEPGEKWHACACYTLIDGDTSYEPPAECFAGACSDGLGRELKVWQDTVLKVTTSNEEFYQFYRQSVVDMASLRLPIPGTDHLRFVPAAGVPWFVALFGRDSLIAALQCVLVYPEFATGVLEVLGELQATEVDNYRDAEPGKIPHEIRQGELARLRKIPHTPYYGSADATPLYLITLHAAWRCIGDRGLLERHLPAAERCLSWIDDYGDRDGDGFQEYETRSAAGAENQSWKDAGDSVMNPDGSPVRGPKALCELQGYVYDAWRRMAEIYDELARPDDAQRLRRKADDLYTRFNVAFWDEESGFYAYCLDGQKAKVLTVASNPGHLLWSGIVPEERAGRVIARLMQPDLWSGWGIRTLSADHPSFNPFSYQNGSIWPHDNGIIALGCNRYGFRAEAARIARDISEAASYFMHHQLPELYAGLARDGANFPVQYPGANVPQAWAAGTSFALLQSMLGFQPRAHDGMLYLDPWLPAWLPDITLHDLRIGKDKFVIRFEGSASDTTVTVLRGDPSKVQRRSTREGSDRFGGAPESAKER